MVKVNLIGKKRRQREGRNWIMILGVAIFSIMTIYFFGSVIYVVYKLNSLNSQLQIVEQDTRLVSSQMLSNNDLLNRFVLSKFILEKIQNVNKSKFRYKDYLDQIASFMPEGVVLKNVDFSIPGWVSVLASASNLKQIKTFEETVTDANEMNKSAFSSVFSENVIKDNLGNYNIKLQFELRKNGG